MSCFVIYRPLNITQQKGKKQDVGMAITCTAETWMSVSCHWELGSAAHATQMHVVFAGMG